jgi:transcriptional regulator with XRE-family HTH domain
MTLVRVPDKLETLGDHLLRRRLTLKLLQRQVAETLGVEKSTLANWEANRMKPSLVYMPAIIQFLGYNPVPPADGWADRLVQGRTALGLTQREAAQHIGVDPSTLARWERGEREPTGAFAARAERFLSRAEAAGDIGADGLSTSSGTGKSGRPVGTLKSERSIGNQTKSTLLD